MAAASPISPFGAALAAAMTAVALLCQRKPGQQTGIAQFILLQQTWEQTLSSQTLLSALGWPAHGTSCLLSPLGSTRLRSWAQAFFEPLIKDKPWHLMLWGGFDDLVAGFWQWGWR